MLLWSLYRVLDWPDREILVVDNGSTDGSRELLDALHHAGLCVLVPNANNIGYGPALNQALDRFTSSSEAKRVWILDSDCVVARPDALADALTACPTAAIVDEPGWDRWHGRDVFGV